MVRSRFSRILVVILVALFPLSALAGNEVGKMSGNASGIDWSVSRNDHESLVLTVQGPDGTSYQKTFNGGQNPSFRTGDLKKSGAVDGTYTYEIRPVPRISGSVKAALNAARAKGDDAAVAEITRANGLQSQVVQSGAFGVLNGSFLDPDAKEADANDSNAAGVRGSVSSDATSTRRPGEIAADDQVIADDLIVTGSACVGFDCVDGESFGFDTIRMKENNVQINFTDTSTSAGFPANDWTIVANDSTSGGGNYLAFNDVTAARKTFVVEAASPANALYVDSTGNIGISQSAPALDLHITAGDTPAMRYEQTNASGFTAQTWDIGANEANFFVRDLTGGSRLSFRIRPGAPTSSIDIAADGNVGIGTASPSGKLHVAGSLLTDGNVGLGTTTPSVRLDVNGGILTNTGYDYFDGTRRLIFGGDATGGFIATTTNHSLRFQTAGTDRMTIDTAGTTTVSGNLTVTGTKNFAMEDPGDAKRAIYYTALEGPEAGTYIRGTAKTVNGEVVVKLPGYFSRITENERMTVQLTPVGAFGQAYVASKAPGQIVIRVAEGADDIEFDYFVQGVRKGYLDYEIERDNILPKQ